MLIACAEILKLLTLDQDALRMSRYTPMFSQDSIGLQRLFSESNIPAKSTYGVWDAYSQNFIQESQFFQGIMNKSKLS